MTLVSTADAHFGDHRMPNIHCRPFATVEGPDEALDTAWKAVVSVDDVVWHL